VGRFFLLVGLGLTLPAAPGCLAIAYALHADCEDLECSGSGLRCQGGKVVECTVWEGDPCTHANLSVVEDCGAKDQRCVNDHCEDKPPPIPREPCRDGLHGECRGNVAHRCEKGKLIPDDCALQQAPCMEIVIEDDPVQFFDRVQAICAISTERCSYVVDATECRDGERVHCHGGYPVRIEPCEGDGVTCVEYPTSELTARAQCTLSVPCPADGGRLCYDGTVHGCSSGETGGTTERLRDCDGLGEACVVRSGQSYCATSPEPLAVRWISLPGGSFGAGSWEPPVVTVGGFDMMEREVTESEYAACATSGACPLLSSACRTGPITRFVQADLPVACVDFSSARAYCAYAGGRLPNELEWEYAFRSAGANSGDEWQNQYLGCGDGVLGGSPGLGCGYGAPLPGCRMSADVTEQGLCDLVGNVEEWVELATPAGTPATRGRSYLDTNSTRSQGLESRRAGETQGALTIGFRCAR